MLENQLAQRSTPEEYWRSKMQVVPVAATATDTTNTTMLPMYYPQPVPTSASNTTALVLLGVVAIVGLVGLFAVLGSSGRCKC